MNNISEVGKMEPKIVIKNLFFVLMLLLSLTSLSAYAATLNQAKAQGLIGEQANGYIGFVTGSPKAQLQSLVNSVNAKRRQEYQLIAKKNATNVQTVEKIAGAAAIRKTTKGHYVRAPGGQWLKKQ